MQTDNLRAVCLVVSLSFHCTTRQTAHKLRLTAALGEKKMTYDLEKEIWTAKDFEVMGWHDNRIYSMAFFREQHQFRLDIDYIFEWVKSAEGTGFEAFWISPSTLCFENISETKINIDMASYSDLEISEIRREHLGKTPNGVYEWWCYKIETNVGLISLKSTGYNMYVRANPISSKSLDIFENRGENSVEIT